MNGNDTSDFFMCNVGVKQGENLSPFLFSIFLNDLEDFLHQNNVPFLDELYELSEQNIGLYVKLFVI